MPISNSVGPLMDIGADARVNTPTRTITATTPKNSPSCQARQKKVCVAKVLRVFAFESKSTYHVGVGGSAQPED